MRSSHKLTSSQALAVVLIRLMVGTVFFLEGIQKVSIPRCWGRVGSPRSEIPRPA